MKTVEEIETALKKSLAKDMKATYGEIKAVGKTKNLIVKTKHPDLEQQDYESKHYEDSKTQMKYSLNNPVLLESFLKTNQNIVSFCSFLDILTKTNQNESNCFTFQNEQT